MPNTHPRLSARKALALIENHLQRVGLSVHSYMLIASGAPNAPTAYDRMVGEPSARLRAYKSIPRAYNATALAADTGPCDVHTKKDARGHDADAAKLLAILLAQAVREDISARATGENVYK